MLLASAAISWPLAARAQQSMPMLGVLSTRGQGEAPRLLAAFRQGLKDEGFVDGQNVAIEYRFADNRNDRLPALAADLAHRPVAAIAALSTVAALAAKEATATIPIVFEMGGDPVRLGLVANLSRPGGNVTGVTQLNVFVALKRLELVHELVPAAKLIGLLVDPTDAVNAYTTIGDLRTAARSFGVELWILNASTDNEIDAAFASAVEVKVGAIVIGGGALYVGRQERLAALALRHAMPAIYEGREFVAAGGLASYGGDFADSYRLAGVYTGRVLKGEKPGDLPVQQGTKVEFYINLKSAKTLGLNVPPTLIGRAVEVIE